MSESTVSMRIEDHPILGEMKQRPVVKFFFDGHECEGRLGEPIAAALHAAGHKVHRYTQRDHKPRGVFCMIGKCTDCVMVVNGVPHVRTCITALEEGMDVRTQVGSVAQEAQK
jgi:predicted molibdopterin-dependent oxidoreductase YjgC